MKKIISLIICFCAFFVVNVSAETLNLNLVSEDNKVLNFDVVVTNVMGANNVFEGEVKYNKDDINSLKVIAADGWEIHTKVKENSIKFIALSMDKVAVENTTIFKVNTEVKEDTKLTLGNVATAGGNVGVSLDEVTYTYKEVVVEDTKPITKPEVTPETKPEVKPDIKDEEVSIPNDDLINNIEDTEESLNEDKKETKKDNQTSKTIVSILVAIAIVTLAFIFLFRKREGEVK